MAQKAILRGKWRQEINYDALFLTPNMKVERRSLGKREFKMEYTQRTKIGIWFICRIALTISKTNFSKNFKNKPQLQQLEQPVSQPAFGCLSIPFNPEALIGCLLCSKFNGKFNQIWSQVSTDNEYQLRNNNILISPI